MKNFICKLSLVFFACCLFINEGRANAQGIETFKENIVITGTNSFDGSLYVGCLDKEKQEFSITLNVNPNDIQKIALSIESLYKSGQTVEVEYFVKELDDGMDEILLLQSIYDKHNGIKLSFEQNK